MTLESSTRAGLQVLFRAGGSPAARSVTIAVPEGAATRLSYEVLEWVPVTAPALGADSSLEGGPADRAAPAVPPGSLVRLEETGRLRHHRTARLIVQPASPGESGAAARIAGTIRIRIDFIEAGGRGEPTAPTGEEPAWETTYQRVLLNYQAARSFRGGGPIVHSVPSLAVSERLAGWPKAATPAEGFSARPMGPSDRSEFRISVGSTGLLSLSPGDLSAAGWPPDVLTSRIRLYEKAFNPADASQPLEREVPILIIESNGQPGVFDGEDRILFYGLDRTDRFRMGFSEARFSHIHTYWLSDEPGTVMGLTPGWREGGPFTTPVHFMDHARFEEDRWYVFDVPSIQGGDFPDVDTHYWLKPAVALDSLEFSTPDVDVTGRCRIQARWQGSTSTTHYVGLLVSRGCPGGSLTRLLQREPFYLSQSYTYDSGPDLSASILAPGCNRLILEGNGIFANDPDSPGSGAWFDSFEVSWPRHYRVDGGRLRFTSGEATGLVEMVVGGLSRPDPLVFDVTDSLNPRQVDLAGATITNVEGLPPRYELRFRPDPVGTQRTWILYEPDAIPSAVTAVRMPPDLGPAAVTPDNSSDAAADVGADTIVLTHPAFLPALQRWVDYRASQGHRVRVVTTQEVWNQFSGGDKSVPAIRTWLRWAFRNWRKAPDYLVLFGDASEDYRKNLADSDPDWVPTLMLYGKVPGLANRLELVGSDNYYVGSLAPGDLESDVYPDIHVGRLPVGTPQEAEDLVDKILAYEQRGAGEAWRSRGLILSDDQYSNSYLGNADYCWAAEEREFERGGDSLAVLLERDLCGSPFPVEHFRLSAYLDSLSDPVRHPGPGDCPDPIATRVYTRGALTPLWLEKASQGCLFMMYSGHGSRTTLTSETLVEFNGSFTAPENRVPEQLTNYGRPFLFIGASCHLNEFEFYDERKSESSIAEEMVLLPGRGAIASIASTGLEFIGTNRALEVYLGRTLLSDPVIDPLTGRPGRILGAAFSEGMVRMASEMGDDPLHPGIYRNMLQSYCLLGDPLLRIDRSAPQITVRSNGTPVEAGSPIAASPGDTTAALVALFTDDVDTGTIEVVEDGVPVPPEQFQVAALPDSQERCSGARLTWKPVIRPSSYPVLLRARDWLGQASEFPLEVVLQVEFLAEGRRILPGQSISTGGTIEARITAPVGIEAGRLAITVNDRPGEFPVEPADSEGRLWTGTFTGQLEPGNVIFQLQLDGSAARAEGARLAVEAVSGAALKNVFFYPSPWEGEGEGRFFYEISGVPVGSEPAPVTVKVFSVAGRPIRTLSGEALPGVNTITWDMKDARGDGLANGVYLFKVSFGPERSVVDRLVVHR